MPGTKEFKELLAFVIALVAATASSLDDGKLTAFDLMKFFKALMKAAPAFSGLHLLGDEIRDLSEEEKAELTAFVAAELEIENEMVEQYIEQAFAVIISLITLLPLHKK